MAVLVFAHFNSGERRSRPNEWMRSFYLSDGKIGKSRVCMKMRCILFPGTMTNSSTAIKWNGTAMTNVADHIALISGWLLTLFCRCPVHYYLSLNCYRCKCTHNIKMKYYLIQLAFWPRAISCALNLLAVELLANEQIVIGHNDTC